MIKSFSLSVVFSHHHFLLAVLKREIHKLNKIDGKKNSAIISNGLKQIVVQNTDDVKQLQSRGLNV